MALVWWRRTNAGTTVRSGCAPEHRREQHRRRHQENLRAEERQLRAALPELEPYIRELRLRAKRGRALVSLRRLRRMLRDYPRGPLLEALRAAAHYGLYDLDRVETMTLKNIHGDFFPLPDFDDEPDPDDPHG
jgi:hypothetical protein